MSSNKPGSPSRSLALPSRSFAFVFCRCLFGEKVKQSSVSCEDHPHNTSSQKSLIRFLLPRPQFIFHVFSPKIACQVQKLSKQHKPKEIELAFSYCPPAILKEWEKNKRA